MAFKMAPKSPVLMATGRFGSPAKQTMKSGSSLTAAEKKEMNDKSAFGPDGKNVAKPPKGKSKSKYDQSPAKQMSQLKNNSPAKQKRTMDQAYAKRDMDVYGDLNKVEYSREAKRQNKVIAGKKKLYTKLGDGTMQTKKDKFGNTDLNTPSLEPNMRNAKGESMNSGNTGGRKITGDVPKTKMKSKTKKVTTLKAEGPKNEGGGLPVAKPIKAEAIKVTKKVAEAKPTRSQKIRAKGEAALASGNTDKAQRLRRRMDRVDARKAKRAEKKAAKA